MSDTPLSFDPHDRQFMHILCSLAQQAGAIIMTHFKNGVALETKADKSVVTQADRDSEKLIADGLAQLTPDIQIIGEEACAEAVPDRLDRLFYLLDPLDGTRDFVAKRQDFTVNIGLIYDRKPIAGVIYAPAHEKLYFSGTDCAYGMALKLTQEIDLSQAAKLTVNAPDKAGLRVLASRSHRAKETDALLDKLHVKELVGAASSYKFCLLAENKADLYPRHGRTMEWDTAAGQAILESAGGVVTLEDGAPLLYGKLERGLDNPSFIAANDKHWHTALK